jgi:hypothetical protein
VLRDVAEQVNVRIALMCARVDPHCSRQSKSAMSCSDYFVLRSLLQAVSASVAGALQKSLCLRQCERWLCDLSVSLIHYVKEVLTIPDRNSIPSCTCRQTVSRKTLCDDVICADREQICRSVLEIASQLAH